MNRIPVILPCLLALSVACLNSTLNGQDANEPAKAVFENGEAQKVPAFENSDEWIRENLWVETEFDSDGDGKMDRMHVDVTRQKQTQTEGLKVPVIYETSPYFCGTGANGKQYFWSPEQELNAASPERQYPPAIKYRDQTTQISPSLVRTWVPRGFAVVHSCSPGTGRSDGCPTVGGDNESLAPKAVVDWLNGRAKGFTTEDGDEEIKADWCTGKVGMTGTSYNGTLPIAAATTGVEGLECIIPIAPNTSYYHYYRSNGLVRHPGGYMGEDIDVLYDFINSGDPERREHCDCEVREKVMQANFDREKGDYNEFWAGRDYRNKLKNYKAATLMAHAFNDWNVMPEHSVRIYEALKEKGIPCQSYFHQGGHGGPPPLSQMNRWFTRYLYGIENDVENDPKAWIVRENQSRRKPTAYAEYPNPEAQYVRVFPTGNGLQLGELGLAGPSQSLQKIVDDHRITGKSLATMADSPNRLLFVTPLLTEELHISGTAKFRIKLASSKPAVNLSVWMVSLPWIESRKVYDNIITRGWADPQNHKSLTESSPLVPGNFYELEFDLQPDDQIIPAGQQIGLMIFASDHDFTLWPEPGTEMSVDLSATSLDLPVVGGTEKFKAATTVN